MSEYITHFLDEDAVLIADVTVQYTLCGLPVTAIILNDRPPTCPDCHDMHADEGWNFPLPATVTA